MAEDQGQPEVLFVYARKGTNVHLQQHGLQPNELALLVTAWWLQLEPPHRAAFVEQLQRYVQGLDQPSAVALGIAAIVKRGGTSPGSPNGTAE